MKNQDPFDHFFRPLAEEYASFYKSYVQSVIDEVADPVAGLRAAIIDVVRLTEGIDEEQGDYRYAAGKWTIKEVLLHLIDTERVFAYRALRIARADKTPLPGFEHDNYVPASKAGDRTMISIIEEYLAVRNASIQMFAHLPKEAWHNIGIASDYPVSVRALAYIMLGHERHHLRILQERYLGTADN